MTEYCNKLLSGDHNSHQKKRKKQSQCWYQPSIATVLVPLLLYYYCIGTPSTLLLLYWYPLYSIATVLVPIILYCYCLVPIILYCYCIGTLLLYCYSIGTYYTAIGIDGEHSWNEVVSNFASFTSGGSWTTFTQWCTPWEFGYRAGSRKYRWNSWRSVEYNLIWTWKLNTWCWTWKLNSNCWTWKLKLNTCCWTWMLNTYCWTWKLNTCCLFLYRIVGCVDYGSFLLPTLSILNRCKVLSRISLCSILDLIGMTSEDLS